MHLTRLVLKQRLPLLALVVRFSLFVEGVEPLDAVAGADQLLVAIFLDDVTSGQIDLRSLVDGPLCHLDTDWSVRQNLISEFYRFLIRGVVRVVLGNRVVHDSHLAGFVAAENAGREDEFFRECWADDSRKPLSPSGTRHDGKSGLDQSQLDLTGGGSEITS